MGRKEGSEGKENMFEMPDGGEGLHFAPTFDTAKFSLPPIPDSRLLKVGVVTRWNNRQNEGGNRCMVYLYVGTLTRVILCNYSTSPRSLKFSILDFQVIVEIVSQFSLFHETRSLVSRLLDSLSFPTPPRDSGVVSEC